MLSVVLKADVSGGVEWMAPGNQRAGLIQTRHTDRHQQGTATEGLGRQSKKARRRREGKKKSHYASRPAHLARLPCQSAALTAVNSHPSIHPLAAGHSTTWPSQLVLQWGTHIVITHWHCLIRAGKQMSSQVVVLVTRSGGHLARGHRPDSRASPSFCRRRFPTIDRWWPPPVLSTFTPRFSVVPQIHWSSSLSAARDHPSRKHHLLVALLVSLVRQKRSHKDHCTDGGNVVSSVCNQSCIDIISLDKIYDALIWLAKTDEEVISTVCAHRVHCLTLLDLSVPSIVRPLESVLRRPSSHLESISEFALIQSLLAPWRTHWVPSAHRLCTLLILFLLPAPPFHCLQGSVLLAAFDRARVNRTDTHDSARKRRRFIGAQLVATDGEGAFEKRQSCQHFTLSYLSDVHFIKKSWAELYHRRQSSALCKFDNSPLSSDQKRKWPLKALSFLFCFHFV